MATPPTGWIERDDLRARLRAAKVSVSPSQLLRWRDRRLLPAPKRFGRISGHGTRSFYPPIALRQAFWIGRVVRAKGTLDDAGWILWLLRFPMTSFVRDLLIWELKVEERWQRWVRKHDTKLRRALRRLAGSAHPFIETMRAVVPRKHLPEVLAMTMDLGAGRLDPERYADVELARLQDAIFAVTFPDLMGEDDVPHGDALRQEILKAQPRSLRDEARAIRAMSDEELITTRDEAMTIWRALVRHVGRGRAGFLQRENFLRFLAARRVDPVGTQAFVDQLRAQEGSPTRGPLPQKESS